LRNTGNYDPDEVLEDVGGMEPGLDRGSGLVASLGRIRHLDVTGMGYGDTETSESRVE
jgi:hypothetical protein